MSPTHRPRWLPLPLALALLAATAAGQGTGMAWSTYFGGPGKDVIGIGSGQRVLPNGDILVWGSTRSTTGFPLRGAFLGTQSGGGDGFVARLRGDGRSLVWSTYLGGSGDDSVRCAAVDASGCITVCGVTRSTNFPTTQGAFQSTWPGKSGSANGFVTRLAWDGSALRLLWSTFLGATEHDAAISLRIHPSGSVVVAGCTNSTDFPMPAQGAPFQPKNAGSYDGFLAVLDSTGRNLQAATYLGGAAHDFDNDVVGNEWGSYPPLLLDSAGNPIVIGWTNSSGIPTTPGAFQRTLPPRISTYVARLDIGLRTLSYGSYLGGNGLDLCWHATIDAANRITLTGTTTSTNFPTTSGAYQRAFGGGGCGPLQYAGDGFVTTLDLGKTGGAQLAWSTYVGTTGCEMLQAVAVDCYGLVTVTGQTGTPNYPVTPGAYQAAVAGSTDVIVSRFDPNRTGAAQLVYSTYLGGNMGDNGTAIDVDDQGNATILGATSSTNFPTTSGCLQSSLSGDWDGFITKLTMLPVPMQRYGRSTPACLTPIHQGVYGAPLGGSANFEVSVCGAPGQGTGAMVIGTPNPVGTVLINTQLFVAGPWVVLPATADPQGRASFTFPVPKTRPPALSIASQWLFLTTAACPGSGPLAASAGLRW